MAALFQCPIELVDLGASGTAWPAPLLQDWAAAFTRQILPWVAPGHLLVEAMASPEAWTLTWVGDAPLPLALRIDAPPDAPRNLPSLWLRATGEHLGVSIEATERGLVASLGRPCAS